VKWLWLACWVFLFAYGVLNAAAPRLTTRWQVSATAKRGRSAGGAVGRAVQNALGIDPTARPDGTVLRRVRLVGLVEMLVASVLAIATWASL
jgi:hypothetical protein